MTKKIELKDFCVSLIHGTGAEIKKKVMFFDLLKSMTSDKSLLDSGAKLFDFAKSDRAKYNKLKERQGGFVIGDFSYRSIDSCVTYAPFIGFDIDHVESKEKYDETFDKLKKWNFAFVVMPSLSGEGMRVIVETAATKETHKDYYAVIAKEISQLTGIPTKSNIREGMRKSGLDKNFISHFLKSNIHIDDSTNDIARFWFYSGLERATIHYNKDARVYLHTPEAPAKDVPKEIKKEISNNSNNSDYPYTFSEFDKVCYLRDKIVGNGIDITVGVREWFKIGCSLVAEFGSQAEQIFYDVSQFHADYNYEKCKVEFNRCLKKYNGSVSIGSFYSLCKDYGLEIDYKELCEIHKDKVYTKKERKPTQQQTELTNDSERCVIGSILQDATLLELLLENYPKLSFEYFNHEKYKSVFHVFQKMMTEGKKIDIVSVKSKGISQDLINSILSKRTQKENFITHAAIVYESYVKSKLSLVGSELIENTGGELQIDEIVDAAQNGIADIIDTSKAKTEVDAKGAVDAYRKKLAEIIEMRKTGKTLIGRTSGVESLDKHLGGYRDGNLIITAARPAMGKSSLMLTKALANARQDISVGFFALEMQAYDLVEKMISMMSKQMPFSKVRNADFDKFNLAHVEDILQRIEEMPMVFEQKAGLTISYVERMARKWKRNHDIQFLFIDYLQLFEGEKRYKGNRNMELEQITKRLKSLAKELNIPINVGCQLNRKCEARADKRPILSDLRDSGAIEQDADIIEFITRPEEYGIMEIEDSEGRVTPTENLAEIIYGKFRGGKTGIVQIEWQGNQQIFKDFDKSKEDIYDVQMYKEAEPKELVKSQELQKMPKGDADSEIPF